MPKGELFIKDFASGTWLDAYDEWGMSMSDTGLSVLMTPVPNKEYLKSSSRLENGTRVIVNAKKDERSLTLPFHITAKTKELFFERYEKVCEILAQGNIWIKTKYQPNVVYKCVYINCSPFSQFIQQMAHFSLKLEEPNPADRSE